MPKWVEGAVLENIHWADNLFTLKVDAQVDTFIAGQFTSLALEIEGERIARPYSYLSAPGKQPLEFFFYTATDGVLSNALVNLKSGDPIWIKQQANGFFTLDEVPAARDLWMFGTGTGIAPYLSILNSAEVWQRFDNIVLVHAVRSLADLKYQEMIAEFQQQYGERFHFQAFISREVVADTINGRIPVALQDGSLEKAVGRELNIEHSQLMLCGNPDMVKDAMQVLKARGFSKNRRRTPGQITVENYW